jgi:magnesium chelatase family protein
LAGLVGGGRVLRPGEITLAHLGVLFLDELPEFPRPSLEALRQPLEEGRLVVSRASGRAVFPTEVLLVAAMNPCPCGWRGFSERCRCPPHALSAYAARVSGPLRDRFDLHVDVRPVSAEALVAGARADAVPEARVREAAQRQVERARRLGLLRRWNARIPGSLLPDAVSPTKEAARTLVENAGRLGLTGRGIHRSLRVARTIADLEGDDLVRPDHVAEAVGLRPA